MLCWIRSRRWASIGTVDTGSIGGGCEASKRAGTLLKVLANPACRFTAKAGLRSQRPFGALIEAGLRQRKYSGRSRG